MPVISFFPCPRLCAWGIAAGLLYIGVVATAAPLPVAILYDGLVPLPPYRWVHPPAARARDNEAPQSGSGTLALGAQGSQAGEISTPDDQALVTFPAMVIGPRPGESSVKVTLTPLDAGSVARPSPGQSFDGNAYRIDASYAASATPVTVTAPVTVVLRYAVHGTQLLRNQDQGWTTLPTIRFDGSQQVLANSDRLGVFVPGGARGAQVAPSGPGRAYIAAGAGLLTVVLGRLFASRSG